MAVSQESFRADPSVTVPKSTGRVAPNPTTPGLCAEFIRPRVTASQRSNAEKDTRETPAPKPSQERPPSLRRSSLALLGNWCCLEAARPSYCKETGCKGWDCGTGGASVETGCSALPDGQPQWGKTAVSQQDHFAEAAFFIV